MNETITEKILATIRERGEERIREAANIEVLKVAKAELVGRHGKMAEVMKEIPHLPGELRAKMGRAANELKNHMLGLIDARTEELLLKAAEIPADFDCTVPGYLPPGGGLHPITQMCYDLNDAFRSLGFEIFQ
ncbi:MAG: hypothetical protein LBB56_06960, partial [Chitinispirillales bacterium]|nr:hypothetical protein [Chitinispirillales bacterium]